MTSYDPTGGHAGTVRFFNPGPVWVRPDVAQAQLVAMVSHRSKDFVALHRRVLSRLPDLFRAPGGHTFTVTGSATAAMEGSLRSLFGLGPGRILFATNGAFSERYAKVADSCGLVAERLDFGWGHAVDAARVAERLAAERFDAVALVHNETSTGTLSPLAEIARAAREAAPDTLILADCVTSLAGAPVEFDAWGLDVAFAGSQKALALPPGLAVVAISDRALERARGVDHRGTYLDFVELAQWAEEKEMTPATPALPLLAALATKLEQIGEETLEGRWARHRRLRDATLAALLPAGFTLYPAAENASPTVTCLHPPEGLAAPELKRRLEAQGFTPGSGYGKLKETTFRVGHMGDVDDQSLAHFLDACRDAAAER